MGRLPKRYWLVPCAAAAAGLVFCAFYNPDVGAAPETAAGGIDGSEAGLYDFFDKSCVQLRDIDWALSKLKQNVDSCGWAGNSDCEENAAQSVEWLVRIKKGGVARVVFHRQIVQSPDWSVYDFGGKPDCSIHVPESYGIALQKVPGHFRDLHSVPQSTKSVQLDLLTHWRTRDNHLRMLVSHYKDNGVSEDKIPADRTLQVESDQYEAEQEARPWQLSEIH